MAKKNFNTISIHAGEENKVEGSVVNPIFQSATYLEDDAQSYNDIRYLRLNNSPNHKVLHTKLAALENTEDALVCASGMAAITVALLANVKQGDHIIAQKELYGGTFHFLSQKIKDLGVEVSFVDTCDAKQWKKNIQHNTKLFYVESISNPLMAVGQLKNISNFCKQYKIKSFIDNTFASPYNLQPSTFGFDIILHSATKYLNGHSDLVAGVICASRENIQNIKKHMDIYGTTLDPHTCFLLQRGLKTLGIRMQRHNENATELVKYLQTQDKIKKIYYPGLESTELKSVFSGFSGMLSFELIGNLGVAQQFLKNITIPLHAPSLGGVESLITIPAVSSHAGLSAQERTHMGIKDSLIRLSVGLEDIEDLKRDFSNALRSI